MVPPPDDGVLGFLIWSTVGWTGWALEKEAMPAAFMSYSWRDTQQWGDHHSDNSTFPQTKWTELSSLKNYFALDRCLVNIYR